MLRDAEHFKFKIGSLEGANDTGAYIVNLVKNKHVPEAPAPFAQPEEPVPVVNGNGKGKDDVTEISEKSNEVEKSA